MKQINKASLVIRTMNEKVELQKWFDYFKRNPFDGELEIVVSDNESTDGTIELARENGCKVIITPRNEFTYPKSLNVGIAAAKNDLVASVVAHAYPWRKDWLQRGLGHFTEKNVVGVYGANLPSKSATFVEWIFYLSGFLFERLQGARKMKKIRMGVMGATNIIIRKSAWQEQHFDEAYAGGGEDTQWAKWAINSGYDIVNDTNFSVRHSHGLHYKELSEQYRHWKAVVAPSTFNKDNFKYKKHLRYEDKKIN